MHYILANDIGRRFTFGLTMETRTIRLYFACRSFLAAREPVDIDKVCLYLICQFASLIRVAQHWKVFVHITLTFGFASREQLGWDTTVAVTDKAKIIKLNGSSYKIIKTLSDHRAFSILGRATRVFEVEDVSTREKAVMKDVWVDSTREREHTIQNSVIKDL